MLLHACCLLFWLHARVPECYDVNGIIIDAIHHFVQTIDDNAAVSLRTVGEERVNLPDARVTLQLLSNLTHLLQETYFSLGTKLLAYIVGDTCALPKGVALPNNFHRASTISGSCCSSRASSSSKSFHASSSGIPPPAAISASASSSMALISSIV